MDEIRHILEKIYGLERGSLAFESIAALMKKFPVQAGQGKGYFSEKDVFLITYGDTLNQTGEVPLKTLHKFAGQQFKDVFSTIHILPFFPTAWRTFQADVRSCAQSRFRTEHMVSELFGRGPGF